MADEFDKLDLANNTLGFDSPFQVASIVGLTKPINAIAANWMEEKEPEVFNQNIDAINALARV